MKWIIITFLLWRTLLFLPLLVGETFLPFNQSMDYTRIWKFTPPYSPVDSVFLYPWANFDGVHYLAIAGEGYSENGRFFPLYPLLINSISLVFGGGSEYGPVHFFVGFFLTNLFFLLSLFVLSKLLNIDYKFKISKQTIILLLLFPTTFFFVSLYTESLFLLLSLLTFYFARKKKWYLAAITGILLSATRLVGVFILPALLLEFYIQHKELFRNKEYTKAIKKGLILFLVPLGLIAFMVFSYFRYGDALNFIHTQGELFNGRVVNSLVTPFQTLYRYFKILISIPYTQYIWWTALFELITTIFAGLMLAVAWKKRVRISYVLFAACCLLLPVLSGTLSGMPRYTLILFPIYMSLALINNSKWRWLYIVVTVPLLILCTLLFSKGYFIA